MTVNAPVTIWQPTDGNSDFFNTGVDHIIDTVGTFLVDPSATFIVDTGVAEISIPATIWTEDNSK